MSYSKFRKSAASGLGLLSLLVVTPLVLTLVAGNPLGYGWESVFVRGRDFSMSSVGPDFLLKSAALIVWFFWIQVVWATFWESAAWLAGGRTQKPHVTPFVAKPVSRLVANLVAGLCAVGLVATAAAAGSQRKASSVSVSAKGGADNAAEQFVPEIDDTAIDDEFSPESQQWLVSNQDSLWSISDGNQSLANQIMALNPELTSAIDVVAGKIIKVPEFMNVPLRNSPFARSGASLVEELPAISANEFLEDVGPLDNVVFFPLGSQQSERSSAPVSKAPSDKFGSAGDLLAAAPSSLDFKDSSGTKSGQEAMALGVGSSLLAAGLLLKLKRQRSFKLASRKVGEVPTDPPATLAELEKGIHYHAELAKVAWLKVALSSLVGDERQPPEEAQPVLAYFTDDHLVLTLSSTSHSLACGPWVPTENGKTWSLPISTHVDQLAKSTTSNPVPTLVTLGRDLLVNLEAVGTVGLTGDEVSVAGVEQSILHQLLSSPLSSLVDVRSTNEDVLSFPYSLVRFQSASEMVGELSGWLADFEAQLKSRDLANTFEYRRHEQEHALGPVVIFAKRDELEELSPLVKYANKCSLPIVVIVSGDTKDQAASMRVELVLEGGVTRLPELEVEFRYQSLTKESAIKIGELLSDAGKVSSRSVSELGSLLYKNPRSLYSEGTTVSGEEPSTVLPAPQRVSETQGPTRVGEGAAQETDLTVKVLGEICLEGAREKLTSQQLSLVAFLACAGASSKDSVIDSLWDGKPISKSRFPNLLAELRAKIGRHHLPEAREGKYFLANFNTDIDEFILLVGRAENESEQERIDTLTQALKMVTGEPFTIPSSRYWAWVGDQTHYVAHAVSLVSDVASSLCDAAFRIQEFDTSKWACEQGLKAAPLDQLLVTKLTEVYIAQGKQALARRLVEDWEERIYSLECGEPSSEPRSRLTA